MRRVKSAYILEPGGRDLGSTNAKKKGKMTTHSATFSLGIELYLPATPDTFRLGSKAYGNFDKKDHVVIPILVSRTECFGVLAFCDHL